jgi:Protein of unknown function DUF262
MKDAQKPDHISLINLIGRLREGRFVIPDFQREFEWKPSDIRELLKSIFLDYYIGSHSSWAPCRAAVVELRWFVQCHQSTTRSFDCDAAYDLRRPHDRP